MIGLHHLNAFSVIESWSGYSRPTDPSGTKLLDLGSADANDRASASSYLRRVRPMLHSGSTFLGFYVGTADSRFRNDNVLLHRDLQAQHVPHVFRLYRGGHERRLWTQHAARWFALALDHLAPPLRAG